MSLNLPIIFLSLALLVTAAVLKLLKPKQEKEDTKVAIISPSNLIKLRQEYVILKNSIGILRDMSSQYFMTLTSNGFQDLCNIESVNQTSTNLKEIGGAARRQRKSTIMMLNEARTALGAGAV